MLQFAVPTIQLTHLNRQSNGCVILFMQKNHLISMFWLRTLNLMFLLRTEKNNFNYTLLSGDQLQGHNTPVNIERHWLMICHSALRHSLEHLSVKCLHQEINVI